MNTHVDKANENKSQSSAKSVSQNQSNGESTYQFIDNRPQAIPQKDLQMMANNSTQVTQLKILQNMVNSSTQLNHIAQLHKSYMFSGQAPVQMVNRLTMHSPPQDIRLAGGGIGSDINTGQEVQNVIDSGNLQDMIDSRNALRQSIQLRVGAVNPDPGHAARILQEQAWLAQLNEAIEPLEKAKQKSWQNILRGPKPPPSSGSGWTPPPGPAWGKTN